MIARMDFSKVRRPLFERHPEWAYRRSDGEIVDEHGDVHVCPSGAYQQERISDRRGDDHDARRGRRVPQHGRVPDARLRGPVPRDLPPARRAPRGSRPRSGCRCRRPRTWRIRRWRPWPSSGTCPGSTNGSTARSGGSGRHRDRPVVRGTRGFVRQESNTALDRREDWPYRGSENTKWVASSFPAMVSSNSSVDFIDYPVRHVAVSPPAARLVEGIANGGGSTTT